MIALVTGARPNYPKVAPIMRALREVNLDVRLVDTGQHYTAALAAEMREDSDLPPPDVMLDVGSGTHAEQTAQIMARFGRFIEYRRPEGVIVVGDVNSTMACAIVTAKAWDVAGSRPWLAHVEAGLRSHDRSMPEEVNRVVTDALSDVLFTTDPKAMANLIREDVNPQRVYFVGNVMVDSLHRCLETLPPVLGPPTHILATLHRPATVDRSDVLMEILMALVDIAALTSWPVKLVCHPRTWQRVEQLRTDLPGVELLPALRYRAFIDALRRSAIVLTDSGGVQEETTMLGVPCLTLRDTTERPVTVTQGTNRVVGTTRPAIVTAATRALVEPAHGRRPVAWDGHAADRIAAVLVGPIRCRGQSRRRRE